MILWFYGSIYVGGVSLEMKETCVYVCVREEGEYFWYNTNQSSYELQIT